MQLGYPTHPRRDQAQEVRWIGQNGFDFVDLFFEPASGDAKIVDPVAVRQALQEYGLGAVGHLGWYVPIGSPMIELRDASVKIAENYLPIFAEAGAKKVTIHANWPPSLFTVEEAIQWQTETIHRIVEIADMNGVEMIYEPVGHYFEDEQTLQKLLDMNPRVGFHLDIGHFNLHGRDPAWFARRFKDRLAHIHLHDNDGTKDQHLPPGTGKIDWEPFISDLKTYYDGTITLEVFSDRKEYVLTAKELVRKWWSADQ